MQKLGIYPLFRLGVVEEVTRSFVIVSRKLDIGRTDILDASFGFGRTGAGNSLARMICNKLNSPVGVYPI